MLLRPAQQRTSGKQHPLPSRLACFPNSRSQAIQELSLCYQGQLSRKRHSNLATPTSFPTYLFPNSRSPAISIEYALGITYYAQQPYDGVARACSDTPIRNKGIALAGFARRLDERFGYGDTSRCYLRTLPRTSNNEAWEDLWCSDVFDSFCVLGLEVVDFLEVEVIWKFGVDSWMLLCGLYFYTSCVVDRRDVFEPAIRGRKQEEERGNLCESQEFIEVLSRAV